MSDLVERWTLGGYAPGNYLCKCSSCDNGFTGDKRAIQCLPCAARHSASRLERLEKALRRIEEVGFVMPSNAPAMHDEAIRIARAALENKP